MMYFYLYIDGKILLCFSSFICVFMYVYRFLFVGFVQNGGWEHKTVVESSGLCTAVADSRGFLCANHLSSERCSKRSWLGNLAMSFHILINCALNIILITFNDVYNNWEIGFQNIVQFVWMGVHQLTILIGDLEQGSTIGWLLLRLFLPINFHQ